MENLVPELLPALFQDCPWVPFDALKSDEAQGRLSRCRPISGLQTARIEDGINHYSHNVGEVNFRRRAPLQLASTMGFVLNNRNGKFLGISDDERAALHECLTWLRPGSLRALLKSLRVPLTRHWSVTPRQPGNNRLCFYGDRACISALRGDLHTVTS